MGATYAGVSVLGREVGACGSAEQRNAPLKTPLPVTPGFTGERMVCSIWHVLVMNFGFGVLFPTLCNLLFM